MDWLSDKGKEVSFYNDILRQYRDCNNKYYYEFDDADTRVLRACAIDLRPVWYSVPTALLAHYVSGIPFRNKVYSVPTKIVIAFGRVIVAAEAFRFGHAIGSYRQGTDCMKQLVSLPTPLGGEISALIRVNAPNHWLLKYEQPPSDFDMDTGARPRIATEENRMKKINKLRQDSHLEQKPSSSLHHSEQQQQQSDVNSGSNTNSDIFGLLAMSQDGSTKDESVTDADIETAEERARRRRRRRRRRHHHGSSESED